MHTYDDAIFSDLYKEIHGIRPRGHEYYGASPDRKQVLWDDLIEAHDAYMRRYTEQKAEAVAHFEERLASLQRLGARTRADAIRWLAEAYDGDLDYLEYSCDLPFGYLR